MELERAFGNISVHFSSPFRIVQFRARQQQLGRQSASPPAACEWRARNCTMRNGEEKWTEMFPNARSSSTSGSSLRVVLSEQTQRRRRLEFRLCAFVPQATLGRRRRRISIRRRRAKSNLVRAPASRDSAAASDKIWILLAPPNPAAAVCSAGKRTGKGGLATAAANIISRQLRRDAIAQIYWSRRHKWSLRRLRRAPQPFRRLEHSNKAISMGRKRRRRRRRSSCERKSERKGDKFGSAQSDFLESVLPSPIRTSRFLSF